MTRIPVVPSAPAEGRRSTPREARPTGTIRAIREIRGEIVIRVIRD